MYVRQCAQARIRQRPTRETSFNLRMQSRYTRLQVQVPDDGTNRCIAMNVGQCQHVQITQSNYFSLSRLPVVGRLSTSWQAP